MSCSIDLRNVDGPMKGIISSLIICCNSMWVCTHKQNKYIFYNLLLVTGISFVDSLMLRVTPVTGSLSYTPG
jgi:hypothetical protein